MAQLHTITANVMTYGGTVSPAQSVIEEGSSATLTIEPFGDYAFDRLYDNGNEIAHNNIVDFTEEGNTIYTIDNVVALHKVEIYFVNDSNAKTYYGITIDETEHGLISLETNPEILEGNVAVAEQDTTETFSIKPDSDYEISDVFVDGESVGVCEHYTFEDIKANHIISATFVPVGSGINGGNNGGGNDDPTPIDPEIQNDEQAQCSQKIITRLSEHADFDSIYQYGLRDYAEFRATGASISSFAHWFVDKVYETIGRNIDEDYIDTLITDGYTCLDLLTVWHYAYDVIYRNEINTFAWVFKSISNNEIKYGRCVTMNINSSYSGDEMIMEYHNKCGFTGEKTTINGEEYYVANYLEDYGYYTEGSKRDFAEPILGGIDGGGYKFYFKNRGTKSLNNVYVYYQGYTFMALGYLFEMMGASIAYNIEYSGESVTADEINSERVESYSQQLNAILGNLASSMASGNKPKARANAYELEMCYKGIERLVKEYL